LPDKKPDEMRSRQFWSRSAGGREGATVVSARCRGVDGGGDMLAASISRVDKEGKGGERTERERERESWIVPWTHHSEGRCVRSRGTLSPALLPQVPIQGDGRQLDLDLLEAEFGDPGAAVEVDAFEVGHALDDGEHALVGEPVALADVEGLEVLLGLGDLADALVADGAGREPEALEIEEALADVLEGLVADLVAERHVEGGYARAALGQVSYADLRDIVAGA
jgi:hypothetical protein